MNGDLLTLPLLILGAVAVLAVVNRWHSNRPETLYANLVSERSAAGVSSAELDHEFTLRTSAASLRRRVSLAVLDRPADYEILTRKFAREEALLLASHDKAAAKSFLEWVEGASLGEILHPRAMKVVWKAVGAKPTGARIPTDVAAALRVIG